MPFLNSWNGATVVLADGGGRQEETTALGVPSVTIRQSTERAVVVDESFRVLVGSEPARIVAEAAKRLRGEGKQWWRPYLWDGKAAMQIVDTLAKELA
ncbi:UDP-N-acetylglucosamine 2-epimerase [Accumulibacter sp.]|jgi:UDP-N-acetylglucosamine 2-epimerase (non-hydrolysing)|uniref:UDP-N-acetylglucosamine 2-epimerase n=1 Tax=Accumulibacter sp. TaxID=2053492 RepID=UPI002583D5C5|nr:UDP-N-acetylglucosamine 2-epimerase [Accumulibacter sp.]